ncbi:MAG: dihydroorotase, partial [Aureibaculum sp.]
LTVGARKRFGLKTQHISVGENANLTLFDPDLEYEFKEEHILSTSKNSAFLTKKLKGKAYGIFSNNKLVLG